MSYKPDEATLMSYLYGELDAKEASAVDIYFQEHPEALKEFQEMAAVVKIMGAVQDKEVIAPPIFSENDAYHISFWKTAAFKTAASIAAAVLFILVAARMIGPDIRYSNGELRISFGTPKSEQPAKPETPVLTAKAIQEMIDQSVINKTSSLDARWNESQQKLNNSIRQSLDLNSKKVDALVKNTSQASQEQLGSYVAGLQKENLKLIKDYFQLSSKEQNDYVENLLIGFSKYMQQQREQDLVLVQNKVNDLEKNSDQFQHETTQLLTSIISNTKPVQKSY